MGIWFGIFLLLNKVIIITLLKININFKIILNFKNLKIIFKFKN